MKILNRVFRKFIEPDFEEEKFLAPASEKTHEPDTARVEIWQIYYDEASRSKMLSGALPLDNTANERPDWFEFWVILEFLRTHKIDSQAWYAFLSPKFYEKTGLQVPDILNLVAKYGSDSAIINLSSEWEQGAYFMNSWEQGEYWHPGLSLYTEEFFSFIDRFSGLIRQPASARQTVFSNYFVARGDWWVRWHAVAEKFFDYVEGPSLTPRERVLRGLETTYVGRRVGMKVFVQERLVNALILESGENVGWSHPWNLPHSTANTYLPLNDPEIRWRLIESEKFKSILLKYPKIFKLDDFLEFRKKLQIDVHSPRDI